jgi:hypothetical protein
MSGGGRQTLMQGRLPALAVEEILGFFGIVRIYVFKSFRPARHLPRRSMRRWMGGGLACQGGGTFLPGRCLFIQTGKEALGRACVAEVGI